MMVNWGHAENALAPQLERPHLQNHGKRFNYEYSPHEKQQNFLLNDDRNNSQRAASREGTYIAHKDFSRVRVVPQKTKRSPDQRAAKNGKFADARDVLDLQIGGTAKIA